MAIGLIYLGATLRKYYLVLINKKYNLKLYVKTLKKVYILLITSY